MKTNMTKREDMMIEIVKLKIIKHDGPKVIKNINDLTETSKTEYFETKSEALQFMTMMMLDVTSATFKLTFEMEFVKVYSSHAK